MANGQFPQYVLIVILVKGAQVFELVVSVTKFPAKSVATATDWDYEVLYLEPGALKRIDIFGDLFEVFVLVVDFLGIDQIHQTGVDVSITSCNSYNHECFEYYIYETPRFTHKVYYSILFSFVVSGIVLDTQV